jgi:hypothetical protein
MFNDCWWVTHWGKWAAAPIFFLFFLVLSQKCNVVVYLLSAVYLFLALFLSRILLLLFNYFTPKRRRRRKKSRVEWPDSQFHLTAICEFQRKMLRFGSSRASLVKQLVTYSTTLPLAIRVSQVEQKKKKKKEKRKGKFFRKVTSDRFRHHGSPIFSVAE